MVRRILALSPHTDDIEFGCGASINKWITQGDEVYAVSFSCGSADSSEFVESSKILGLKEIEVLHFHTRRFPEYRQLILDTLLRLNKKYDPHLVVIPSSSDTHQDHQVVREEGFRAFKRTSLIGYEMPQNNLVFKTNMFVKCEEKDMDMKINALRCYGSQKHRPYISEEFIKGLGRVRGMQAGSEFAEAFEVIRWVQ